MCQSQDSNAQVNFLASDLKEWRLATTLNKHRCKLAFLNTIVHHLIKVKTHARGMHDDTKAWLSIKVNWCNFCRRKRRTNPMTNKAKHSTLTLHLKHSNSDPLQITFLSFRFTSGMQIKFCIHVSVEWSKSFSCKIDCKFWILQIILIYQ